MEHQITRANFIDPIDREHEARGCYDTHVQWFAVAGSSPGKSDPDA
jgi:hypothetical protein